MLGDNIFYGDRLEDTLKHAVRQDHGATVFGYYVSDPERYGVGRLWTLAAKRSTLEEKTGDT